MILGILLITQGHSDAVLGLARAARQQGHSVTMFMMDDGVFYSQEAQIADLARDTGISISLCERSCQWRNIEEHMIPDGITAGSQMQNAMMHSSADRVLVI